MGRECKLHIDGLLPLDDAAAATDDDEDEYEDEDDDPGPVSTPSRARSSTYHRGHRSMSSDCSSSSRALRMAIGGWMSLLVGGQSRGDKGGRGQGRGQGVS